MKKKLKAYERQVKKGYDKYFIMNAACLAVFVFIYVACLFERSRVGMLIAAVVIIFNVIYFISRGKFGGCRE